MILNKKTKLLQKTAAFALLACLTQSSLSFAYDTTLRTGIGTSTIVDLYSSPQYTDTSTVQLNASAKITSSKAKINLSLRDSDVQQVLRMFADKAGVNIVFHESVKGKVSLDLINTTLNDAFMLVLDTTGLSYFLDNTNTIIVASKEEAAKMSFARQNLTVLPVKYVDATSVAEFLNSNVFGAKITGLSNEKIVTVNPGTNEIMVFGSKNDVDVAKKIISKLDTKPMMNTFKVNHTTPKEMAELICSAMIKGGSQDDDKTNSVTAAAAKSTTAAAATVTEVTLGGGKIACQSNNRDSDASKKQQVAKQDETAIDLKPFSVTPMSIAYYPQLGTIGVFGGSIQQVEIVRDFITKNDKKQLMAYLEMSVVELSEDGSKEFNNTWGMATPFGTFGFDGNGFKIGTTANPIKLFEDTGGVKILNGSGSTSANYALNYIVGNGNGRILTNPKIIVTNGQKSVIDMTSDYIKTIKTEYQQSTLSTPITNRTVEVASDDGLKIEIMPFISLDGYVTLNLIPNYATIKERVYDNSTEGDLLATLLQRRNLELKNLRIKDGETLVIAGMIREEEMQSTTKVPVLGDLPLLGVMFRNSKTEKQKLELVIMITPHIVYDDEQLANVKSDNL